MKNKNLKTATIAETLKREDLKPLSNTQLKVITGGTDPTLSRGTKTSAKD